MAELNAVDDAARRAREMLEANLQARGPALATLPPLPPTCSLSPEPVVRAMPGALRGQPRSRSSSLTRAPISPCVSLSLSAPAEARGER